MEVNVYFGSATTQIDMSPMLFSVMAATGPQGETGPQGNPGTGIASYTECYALTSGTSAPAYSAFTPTVLNPTPSERYLWGYTLIEYTDGSEVRTNPHLICVYGQTGNTGATGNGIASIAKTGTSGLVDTYTVTMTNGSTSTFTVTNGEKGDTGDKGDTGATGPGVAAGGTAGQVLYKKSATDYDTEWADPEVTAEQFAALEGYVRDMSPLETVGPASVVSVSDAAPLSAEQVVVDIEAVQAGSGDPSPTNVRPITGWTGAKVTRTGKNLLGYAVERIVSVPNYNAQKVVWLKAGTTYTFSFASISDATNWRTCIILYNADGTRLFTGYDVVCTPNGAWAANQSGRYYVNGANETVKEISFTVATDCFATICFLLGDTVTTSIMTGAQLELGSTATPYAPYTGTTLPVTFPASAGTVYGGTLTIDADGGGELTVTHVGVIVGNLSVSADLTIGTYSCMMRFTLSEICVPAAYTQKHGAISNMGVEDTAYYSANRTSDAGSVNVDFAIALDGTALAVYDSDLSLTSETFMEKYGGMQVIYPLAAPVTYTLTAEQIMLLRGVNNVWADCGDTTLAYRADIPAYIDQRINATRSMIAGVEAGMQATKAYSAGDLLIVGDTLYKATTSIASGATFTPGTNVTATTVAEQLILLANA